MISKDENCFKIYLKNRDSFYIDKNSYRFAMEQIPIIKYTAGLYTNLNRRIPISENKCYKDIMYDFNCRKQNRILWVFR